MFKICFSLPTDCPQRDERKGWMGDAALTVGPALIMFPELERFFIHWLDVIRDSQVVNGNGKGYFVFVFVCLFVVLFLCLSQIFDSKFCPTPLHFRLEAKLVILLGVLRILEHWWLFPRFRLLTTQCLRIFLTPRRGSTF